MSKGYDARRKNERLARERSPIEPTAGAWPAVVDGNEMETAGCNQAKNAGLPNLPKTV
jgi:hypothetical protein